MMMKFILLFIVTRDVFAYGALISANSLNMENHKNICGGKTMCKHHPHTHQISLQYGRHISTTTHICGGSIIAPMIVLTAAHCLTGMCPKNIFVVAGIINVTDVGQRYSVKKIHSHASYNKKALVNDIGIVVTGKRIVFGPRVQSIPLYKRRVEAGKSCVTSGWGTNILDGPPSHTLQELTTSIITAKKCTDHQPNRTPEINDETQICVLRGVGMGVCQGDSGGPLVCYDQLSGIVSWGRGCAVGFPEVFTNVSAYIPWIENIIQSERQ